MDVAEIALEGDDPAAADLGLGPAQVIRVGAGRVDDTDGEEAGDALGDLDRPLDPERVVALRLPDAHGGRVGDPAGEHLLADDAGHVLALARRPGLSGPTPGRLGGMTWMCASIIRAVPSPESRVPSHFDSGLLTADFGLLRRPSRCSRSPRTACGPVIALASGLHRKTVALATSSGSIPRGSGDRLAA